LLAELVEFQLHGIVFFRVFYVDIICLALSRVIKAVQAKRTGPSEVAALFLYHGLENRALTAARVRCHSHTGLYFADLN